MESSGTYWEPNVLTTQSTITGMSAEPNEPPAAKRLMLRLRWAPVSRAIAAAAGW